MTSSSEYDKMYRPSGGSLHYLDGPNATMITLRGVSLRHAPQRHICSTVISHGLGDILTNNQGEFIHPGEHECREVFLKEIQERQTLVKRVKFMACEPAHEFRDLDDTLPRVSPGSTIPMLSQPDEDSLLIRRVQKKEPLLCEGCGVMTTNWTSCTPAAGVCLCRDCVIRKFS